MKFPPLAIWVALFALLSCAAEGRGFGPIYSVDASADVCDAQAQIASFSSERPHASALVCDFQRALGAMNSGATSTADLGSPALFVTVDPSRVCLPCSAHNTAPALWALQLPSIVVDSTPHVVGAPTLSGPPPGVRFSYRLAPHAPPLAA